MRKQRRLPSPWILIGVLCLVGAFLWRSSTGPANELGAELRELARIVSAPDGDDPVARANRIRDAVARNVAPDAIIDVEEAPGLDADPAALTAALVGLVTPGEAAVVELTSIDLEIVGDGASANVDARLGSDVGRDLHARQRRLNLRLARATDHWRVTSATMRAATDPEPEARP
ncbi:MAG: hypothetical protein JW751_07885 [Polyangiaceae bacterium]|nr:hypothetical protein [Polyangiaceae bacterium]